MRSMSNARGTGRKNQAMPVNIASKGQGIWVESSFFLGVVARLWNPVELRARHATSPLVDDATEPFGPAGTLRVTT